jgi:colanic acid/amylovoran biosynthesis protein
MHAGYRHRYGLVAPHEVDGVLDTSGYFLGDPWRPEWIAQRASYFERMQSAGKPIVVLPQAMGPFRDGRVAAAAKRLLMASGLAFARDRQSFEAARTLAPGASLRLAPDFTNLLRGRLPPDFRAQPRQVALIPNNQVLVHGHAADGRYVSFFAEAIRRIRAAGYDPILLLHEENADPPVAAEIRSASGDAIRVVCEADAVALKGLIGACAFTVGSRFHGLVSALSQGVPSLGTSWSHKYVDPAGDWDDIWPPLNALMDERTRGSLRERLCNRARLEQDKSRSMWSEVEGFLLSAPR